MRTHSIIGIRDRRHPELGDGWVSLESARWPTAESHLLDGDHAVHDSPATAGVIKKILLDRIERLRE